MRVLVNGLSVTAGGGYGVAANLLSSLSSYREHQFDVLVKSDKLATARQWGPNIRFCVQSRLAGNSATRVIWEQVQLPRMMRDYDVLLGLAGVGVITVPLPQVVVAQNAHFFAPLSGYPFVIRIRSGLQRSLFRMTMARGAACVAVSETIADQVRCCIGGHADVTVILNAPDLTGLGADPNPRSRRNPATVLWVGGRAYHKNLPEFLDAAAILLEELSAATNVEFLVMGDVHEDQVDSTLSPADLDRDLRPSVHLLGNIEGRERLAVLRSASVVVLTSQLEAGPLVPLEASVLKVPVVASDIPAHREFLDPSSLYVLGDPGSLASSIRELLMDRELRDCVLRSNARRVSGISWNRSAGSYLSILSRVSRSGGRRPSSSPPMATR